MSTHLNTPSLHPALMIAAVSVTALSLAGVAKLTGVLPDFGAKPPAATESVAAQPTPPEAPPSAPLAKLESATAPAAPKTPEATPEPRPTHPSSRPTSAREHAKPAPAVAKNVPPPADAVPAPPPVSPRHTADTAPPACRDCGVIERIEPIEQKGEGSGIGAVGGAILGGVLGHQVGEGSGKQLARIGGAVLGGFAGNEVEKRTRTVTHYQVTVRMEDGSRRVIQQQGQPGWRNGDPVRVRNGEIVAAGAAF
ncbi:MAG: glycine zipper 2TM domain-containing protein [Zoogloea sp.]|uniref:glycine zipper 2TM domain-containing protein n=1 Tax=Zoogloea sp. TaxID=49181 RepID=UPI0026238365|nr:glycine zipper 2TM domain-containing protein [Zoogloea sp.]MDD2988987.1 glycine zipper 2TM domain-containing protein [Zoogloea sp.]